MSRLTMKERISYGLGDFGNGFMFDLGQAYLLKFYTDVAGLPGALAGGVFLFTKVFDAFMDPLAGTFVDSNRRIGRFGRFRPVMMYSSIALGILTVFTFLTPGGTEGVNLAYAYATYMIWGVAYAFTNTPYGSLASVMTQDSPERAKLASFRQGGSVGALLVTGVAFLPIARAFESERVGYAVAASVLAFFGIIAFYACFRGTREHVVAVRQHAKLTPRVFATTIGTNRPLLVLILMTVFSISAYNIKTAMTIYYTQYYLHDASVLPYVNFIAIGSSIIGIVAMPVLVKRFGKKHTAIFGFALAGTADGINFLLPSNTVIFTVLLALSFIGVAIPNGVTWAMVSDVIDYGQWRTRRRSEGITYSMFNFSRKIAQSIAGGVAGFGLTLIGYVPNVVDQTPGTLLGIKALQTLYPCIAFFVAAAVLIFLYPLTDARLAEIVKEMHESDQVADVRGDEEVTEIDPTTMAPAGPGTDTDPTSGPERREPDGPRP